MRKFTLISKDDPTTQDVVKHITKALLEKQWTLDPDHPEVVISVGGDGTFLRAIHTYQDHLSDLSFVGLHTGTLGFLTNYACEEWEEMIEDLVLGQYQTLELPLLEVCVETQGVCHTVVAVNEMRVENVIRTQLLDVSIDGKHLETFRGNGICVSTQVGSTAYNRSLGGAILYEGLNALQLTEITGIHHHAYRSLGSSLILNKDTVITLESDNFNQALLCYDYLTLPLNQKTRLTVAYSQLKAKLMIREQKDYIERLKSLF
jgi:NAD+ kinase